MTVPDEQSLHLPGGGLAAGVMGNDSYFDLKKSGVGPQCAGTAEAGRWPRPLGVEGIEAIVFRTVGDHISLWEATLPAELLVLTDKLARVDRLLDDPTFLAPLRIVEGGQLALL